MLSASSACRWFSRCGNGAGCGGLEGVDRQIRSEFKQAVSTDACGTGRSGVACSDVKG